MLDEVAVAAWCKLTHFYSRSTSELYPFGMSYSNEVQMRNKRVITLDELRRKFPLGATVYYKGKPIGTVCGYNRWINGSYNNEPEVLYVAWKILREYPSKIGQFTVRSNDFRTKPFELTVYDRKADGTTSNYRKITVFFDPKEQFEYQKIWKDVTNNEWAIWSEDLHKVVGY